VAVHTVADRARNAVATDRENVIFENNTIQTHLSDMYRP
jgi:hypothetical protein